MYRAQHKSNDAKLWIAVLVCCLSFGAIPTTYANGSATEYMALLGQGASGLLQTNTSPTDTNTSITTTSAVNTHSNRPTITSEDLILNSPVVDEAGILSQSDIDALSHQIRAIYDDNLAQIAVVIVPTTNGVPIFDYALATARRWQLGSKDTNNGVLIFVAINDRGIFITTGYGVEGVLPDVALNRIIREQITPAFKQGQFAGGLSSAIAKIDERLRADPDTLARADQEHNPTNDSSEVIPIFVMAFIFGMFMRSALGRLLGATLGAGGFVGLAIMTSLGLVSIIGGAVVLWLLLCLFDGRNHYRGGNMRSGGSFGGSLGGHTLGGGGFRGGGGSFGGGGAGGSW